MFCCICTKEQGLPRTITHDEKVVLQRVVCQPCWDKAFERYQELQGTYDELLKDGHSEKEANRMMFELVKQELAV